MTGVEIIDFFQNNKFSNVLTARELKRITSMPYSEAIRYVNSVTP